MEKAFEYVSPILGEKAFVVLGWKKFTGTVEQFHLLIEDFSGNYPTGYVRNHEQDGQKRWLIKFFQGISESPMRCYLF